MSMKNRLGPKNSKESGLQKVGEVKSNRQLTEFKLNWTLCSILNLQFTRQGNMFLPFLHNLC